MISFVVDRLPLHYYQAELLLHSLELNTNYSKADIIIQCLNRVEQIFLDFLKNNNYIYNIIEPYIDGKYCNKLQQLKYFKDKDISGVILMDTDMLVLDNLDEINGDYILAKIVDQPNPTLNTLKKIYKDALLSLPSTIGSDCDIENNTTFENNFNGGFYFIPKKQINKIEFQWRKWAEWLYTREELFEKKSQFIHVDQISFSLALRENNIDFKTLSANFNFPIHFSHKISSYIIDKDIKVLHYHREINQFGLINTSKIVDIKIIKTIENINEMILKKDIIFFKNYQNYQKLNFSQKVISFQNKLITLTKSKKLNLFIHAGTPKTATTSLQNFLAKNSLKMKEQNFLYPSNFQLGSVPKHQWLVSTLKKNDFNLLFEYISYMYFEAIENNINNIFISTEGIYNHWWDYSADAKAVLNILSKYFNTHLIIVFREKESFLKSFYKQNLKNPQMNSVFCYGKDLSLDEMKDDKWFIQHLDYNSFLNDCRYIFEEKKVISFEYSKNIIQNILEYLGLDIDYTFEEDKNKGLSSLSIELLRIINRYNLKHSDKVIIIDKLYECDNILKKY